MSRFRALKAVADFGDLVTTGLGEKYVIDPTCQPSRLEYLIVIDNDIDNDRQGRKVGEKA